MYDEYLITPTFQRKKSGKQEEPDMVTLGNRRISSALVLETSLGNRERWLRMSPSWWGACLACLKP